MLPTSRFFSLTLNSFLVFVPQEGGCSSNVADPACHDSSEYLSTESRIEPPWVARWNIRFKVFPQETAKSGRIFTNRNGIVIKSLLGFLFAALVFVQVPQWDNDWTKCSVSVPDTACHWYVVNPDNTFGKGFSWITAPEFDVAALNDIGAQHEATISQGYQTTVELMNANSNVKYGDDY